MLDLATRMLKHGYLIASMTLFDRFPVRQAAALCYRFNKDQLEILLITSRRSARWGIPKGSIEGDETSHLAAAREAFEEAGIRGDVCSSIVGEYEYWKEGSGRRYAVTVHLLDATTQLEDFDEMGQRQMRWVSVEEAAGMLAEPALRRIVMACELPSKLR